MTNDRDIADNRLIGKFLEGSLERRVSSVSSVVLARWHDT